MSSIPQVSTPNQTFVIDSNKLSELFAKISASIQELAKVSSKLKPFEFNFDFSSFNSDEFSTNLNQISKAIEEYALKTPKNLESYVSSIERRTKEYHEMMDKIKSYPLKSITNQIKIEALEKGIDEKNITKFIKKVNKSVINIATKFSMDVEEKAIEKIYENELEKINTDYLFHNRSLQILNPNKYKFYRELIKKALLAYRQDFKAFINKENICSKAIEKLFAKLMDKMEILDQQYNAQITTANQTPFVENKSINFPTHIFKNQEAFQFFTEYANKTTKSEDIGFAFRQMSEKESPQLIVAKETVFRNWFNEDSVHELELNSAIKTLARFGNSATKQSIYNLIREKYFPTPNKGCKAA